jgi:hypothetical protein
LRIRPVMYFEYPLRTYGRQDLSPALTSMKPECYKVRPRNDDFSGYRVIITEH